VPIIGRALYEGTAEPLPLNTGTAEPIGWYACVATPSGVTLRVAVRIGQQHPTPNLRPRLTAYAPTQDARARAQQPPPRAPMGACEPQAIG
jgi:hypothetical protein